MTGRELLSHVDHTLLKADASWEAISALCKEAIAYNTASVCIPSSYVRSVAAHYGKDLAVCTVIGFPLGYQPKVIKVLEAEIAVVDGADEVDTVINIGHVKNKKFDLIEEELKALKAVMGDKILKVIIETCYLTEEEKIELCHIVTRAKADYIKTSTGFGSAGATLEDVLLFKKHIGPEVKIKAAGGIRTVEDMLAYLEAGCDRIGASLAVALVKDRLDEEL